VTSFDNRRFLRGAGGSAVGGGVAGWSYEGEEEAGRIESGGKRRSQSRLRATGLGDPVKRKWRVKSHPTSALFSIFQREQRKCEGRLSHLYLG
jgi:hypothetical protein